MKYLDWYDKEEALYTSDKKEITVVYIVLCLCPFTLFQRPGVGRAHKSL